MDIQLLVLTADQIPIPGATIGFGNGVKSTDQTGTVMLSNTSAPFTVSVTKEGYLDSTVTVSAIDPDRIWDDAGTTFRPITGPPSSSSSIVMEIRLGRMSFSPTVPLIDETSKLFRIPEDIFASFKPNPKYWKRKYQPGTTVMLQNAFVAIDPATQESRYSFITSDAVFNNVNFWSATDPSMLAQGNNKGPWKSLNNPKARLTKPQLEGNFMMVEWTAPETPSLPQSTVPNDQKCAPKGPDRYLVGLWRPRSIVVPGTSVDGSIIPRDVIVFYHPPTKTGDNPMEYPADTPPFRCKYPYALNQYEPHEDGNFPLQNMGQQYVEILEHYVFNRRFLAHQLLAAKRDALLIVPIQPWGQWGLLSQVEGVSRLIAESILFEHRLHPLKDVKGGPPDSAPSRNDRGGVIQKLIQKLTHAPVPPLGIAVVAGYSAGIAAVKDLLTSAGRYNRPPPPRTWESEVKLPYTASPTDFLNAWHETWDLDGSRPALDATYNSTTKSDESNRYQYLIPYSGLLASWQARKPNDRIVRVYRTTVTMPDGSNMSYFDKILGRRGPRNSREMIGDKGSWVFFKGGFFTQEALTEDDKVGKGDGSTPASPVFDLHTDDHQAVPAVCFAHAAGNSKLRALSF